MTEEFSKRNLSNVQVNDETTELISSHSEDEDVEHSYLDSSNVKNLSIEPNGSPFQLKRNGLKKLCFFIVIIPLKLIYCLIVGPIKGISKMVDSDINDILRFLSTYLGINCQPYRRIIKQVFIISLLAFAIVYTKPNEGSQSYENKGLFPNFSIVTDFSNGEISLLRQELAYSDMALVMYYAPWDRESQELVPEFLEAALYHHEQVTFCAINCWAPKSECQRNFKFNNYPLIVLHVKPTFDKDALAIVYPGPLTSHHIIRFVSDAMRPYLYFTQKEQLLELLKNYLGVAIGYFPVEVEQSKEFSSFYRSAINRLQFEQLNRIHFAVVTDSDLARRFSLLYPSDIQLRTRNKIYLFPRRAMKNMQNITKFLTSHSPQGVHFIRTNGVKSASLDRVFRDGPFLLAFIQDNPYRYSNDIFRLVESVATEYHACHSGNSRASISTFDKLSELKEFRFSRQKCEKHIIHILMSKPKYQRPFHNVCETGRKTIFSFDFPSWVKEDMLWDEFWDSIETSLSVPEILERCEADSEPAWYESRPLYANGTWKYRKRFRPRLVYDTQGTNMRDDYVAHLIDMANEDHCKRLFLSSSYDVPPIIDLKEGSFNITGMGCSGNQTLNFVAIDSFHHSFFAHRLGVKFPKWSPNVGVAIVNPSSEEIFHMKESVSRSQLKAFVYNFTHQLLDRGYRSSSSKLNANRSGKIIELKAENYLKTVKRRNEAFLVLHYKPHCGAAIAIGSVFLELTELMSSVANVSVARIDVSNNDLPFHLTFASIPVILLYPHERKGEAKVLDRNVQVTLRNLVAFLLPELKLVERVALALKICNGGCKKNATKQSLLDKMQLLIRRGHLKHKLRAYDAHLNRLQQLTVVKNADLMKLHIFSILRSATLRNLRIVEGKISHIDHVVSSYLYVP